MMNDQRAVVLGVSQYVTHDLRVGDAALAVGEGDGRVPQQSEFGHVLALQFAGHGGHGVDLNESRVARAAQHEVDQRHVVDHRVRIGHAANGGDAGRRRAARGRQRLARCSWPGSPQNTIMSMRPGAMVRPPQSSDSRPRPILP